MAATTNPTYWSELEAPGSFDRGVAPQRGTSLQPPLKYQFRGGTYRLTIVVQYLYAEAVPKHSCRSGLSDVFAGADESICRGAGQGPIH